jgi:hypothetical protein
MAVRSRAGGKKSGAYFIRKLPCRKKLRRLSLQLDESVRIQTKNKGVGLIRLPAKYIAAKKQMFPNANLFLLAAAA